MLSEYVTRTYPHAEVRFRVRLGTITPAHAGTMTPEEARAVSQPVMRWADAVVVTELELVLIEAKMRSEPGAIAQLEIYRDLVPLTQELVPFLSRPLVAELVCSIEDPVVTEYARRRGIRVKVYRPAWLPAWLEKRNRREGRPRASGGLV